MNNYTKGKWYWRTDKQGDPYNLRSKDDSQGYKSDSHVLYIADDFSGENSLCNPNDANLIAAAPEMYEALKDCKRWLFYMKASIPLHGHLLEVIEQALTKAEGKNENNNIRNT